ncbi:MULTISPECIES: 2Fe-2S iron-sulfur cluster-binding protein [unclassified Streptomyces]|uniref:2Fe-2S iron-sulfur cluster-binding protein n=1 Tax=unclassified Streptomyces TaxID=2593676 RepID=UPI0033CADC24
MSDDQNTHNGGGWQPHPQGEYDSDATAFVQLPEGMLDAPLAAPGHGYVPPQITVTPATADATDPAATGTWVMPPEVTGAAGAGHAVRWPEAGAAPQAHVDHGHVDHGHVDHGHPEHGHAEGQAYDPRATGQWSFAEAEAAQAQHQTYGHGQAYEQDVGREQDFGREREYGDGYGQPVAAPPADVTGQWSIPVADGDLPDESGEFTASSLASQWGGTPPATLPGGAPAPWATGAGAGAPWGAQAQEALRTEVPPPPAPDGSAETESRFEKTQLLRAIRIPSGDAPSEPLAGPAEEPFEPFEEPVHEPAEEAAEPVEVDEPVEADEPAEVETETETEAEAEAEAETEVDAEPADLSDEAHVPEVTGAANEPGVPEETPEPPAEEPTEATAVTEAAAVPEAAEPVPTPLHDDHPLVSYVLRVNGTDRPVTDAWIGESLLYVLRERLGLAGAKDGCSQGECGACNVQVDGRLVASCLVPAATTAGSEVRTVEGLATDGQPSDVQRALAACGAVQCGFCVPGMAMTVHDLLEGNPAPSDLETRRALCGNLCRCSGYRGVLDAVREVVAEREESAAATEPAAQDEDRQADTARIPHQAGPGDGGVHPAPLDGGYEGGYDGGYDGAYEPEGPQGPYGQDGGHA